MEGVGVTKSVKEAIKWFRKAAAQNDAKGQFNLGVCYSKGDGVEKSETEAIKWWKKAAKQGDEGAIKNQKNRKITNFD